MITTAKRDPIELRKAGFKALNAALGHDDAQAFIRQFSGTGDFTKERHELPPRTHEEIMAGIRRVQAERADIIAAKNEAWEKKTTVAICGGG